MPEVTIVIPTYNRSAWLAETVASAKAAASDAEIIVVDDASTDGTAELCRQMEGIRYIRVAKNSGTSHARNLAIAESSSDLIAFLDDDDLRLPGSLDRQVELLKRSPEAGLVYGRTMFGDWRFGLPTGLVVPEECPTGDVYWPLLEGNFIAMSTVVARKQSLIEAGLFDPDLQLLEDYDLWVRLADRYPVEALPEPVSIYRMRGESSGQKTSNRATHEQHHKKLHQSFLRRGRAAKASRRQRNRTHHRHMEMIYGSLIHDAAVALLNGNTAATREYLWAAARLNPFHLKAHLSLLWLFARDLVRRFR